MKILTEGGWLSTVDLLINVPCLRDDLTSKYNEVKRTELSTSVRVSWLYSPLCSMPIASCV